MCNECSISRGGSTQADSYESSERVVGADRLREDIAFVTQLLQICTALYQTLSHSIFSITLRGRQGWFTDEKTESQSDEVTGR